VTAGVEEMADPTVPLHMLHDLAELHRIEVARQRILLTRYRLLLEEHGIEPPDDEGADLLQMWRDCRTVIQTANEFVMKLGSSAEMLKDWG
jgi:hypothetical protein